MALPAFREDGWLPEGHHAATWREVALRFGGEAGSRRAAVLLSLLQWRDAVGAHGLAGLVFLYDAATEALVRRDPEARALTDYQECRARGFQGDVFALPASLQALSPALDGLDMFDFDRRGMPKGVVEVIL